MLTSQSMPSSRTLPTRADLSTLVSALCQKTQSLIADVKGPDRALQSLTRAHCQKSEPNEKVAAFTHVCLESDSLITRSLSSTPVQ